MASRMACSNPAVSGLTPAAQEGQWLHTSRGRGVGGFQNHHGGPAGSSESIALPVEWPHGLHGICCRAQCTHGMKGHGAFQGQILGSDHHDAILTPEPDGVGRVAECVCRGSAGRDEAAGFSSDSEHRCKMEAEGACDAADDAERMTAPPAGAGHGAEVLQGQPMRSTRRGIQPAAAVATVSHGKSGFA